MSGGRYDRWSRPGGAARDKVKRGSGAFRPAPKQSSVLTNPGSWKRDAHEPDYIIVVAVVALTAIGILMVYSASAIDQYAQGNDTFHLVAPQVLAGLLGLVAMLFFAWLDYRWLRVMSLPLLFFALFLLAIVLLPRIGVSANGSARWIQIGSLPEIHPSEIAKLALVIYLSHWLANRGPGIKSFLHGTVPFGVILIPFLILVVREPDLGTASVIVIIAMSLYFVAGARLAHLALAGGVGVVGALAVVVAMRGYPLERIRTLVDPFAYSQGSGFQTVKGLEAISAGGLFGTGLGNNKVVVPADVNDFIFSVIAQQMGLVGASVVIGLFLILAYSGIRTAVRAPDTFGALVATGITAWLCFQAMINIGVVVAVVPVTGITLPFVSAGGSSLTVSLAAVGVLLSISRETVERGWMSASADSGRGYGGTYIPGSRRGSIASG